MRVKKIVSLVLLITLLINSSFSVNAEKTSVKEVVEIGNTQINNSIDMLNYLTVVTQEINDSSNSRIYLEDVYSSLINNISPNAVDKRTKVQLNNMLDTIDQYRMIDVKRERLQYIYEQNKAQAMHEAVPNPLSIMSGVQAKSMSSLVASVVFMAVDSKSSYDSAKAHANMEYLKDGWELDDAAQNALNSSREQLFNYMIDMVNEYNIPDSSALNEDTVNEFVKWKNNSNISRRIQYLESNKDKYKNFGPYWLECAKSYYENGEYKKCIKAVNSYESLNVNIFRKNRDYANVLLLAIASADEIYKDNSKLEKVMRRYVESLTDNIETEDWALRYYAAQTYLRLYAIAGDDSDIDKAFDLIENNVNYLIDEQKLKNSQYIEDIVERKIPDGCTSEQKKEIKNYNKMIKNQRKTELPTVYEPLQLNCELLFALESELDLSEKEKSSIESMLHDDSELFLVKPLEEECYFADSTFDLSSFEINYNKNKIEIPAELISDDYKITVKIKQNKKDVVIDDWVVDKVNRNNSDDISEFVAVLSSKKANKIKYKDNMNIKVFIQPISYSDNIVLEAKYKVKNDKIMFINNFKFVRL